MTIRQSSARLRLGDRGQDVHYRVSGSGPPLFLLHPSPLCSAFMEPLMRRLAHRATLIAPDTPGFGASDPIRGEVHDLSPYVQAMIALRLALGLDEVAVYGSATGAQIAIEWAKADAQGVCGLVLDNAADFTDAERERIMDGYFPDMTPMADGAHLARAWRTAHDATLFFPWHQPEASHRIAPSLGTGAAMDMTARAYLAAGPGYQAAYHAAFRNERAQRVQAIQAPLVIMRWQGSILKSWTDRFDDYAWGDHVVMAHCGPSPDQRWQCLEAHLNDVLPRSQAAAGALQLDTGAIRYADAEFGQIRYRVPLDAPPSGIALHGLGGTGELVGSAMLGQGCVRIDLPGHGGSAEPEGISPAHCVQAVLQVLAALDAGPLKICGVGAVVEVARQVAAQEALATFVKADAPWHEGELPSLAPETSGAHLWRAWHWLRGQYLRRNAPPPEPVRLTKLLLALLRSEQAYRSLVCLSEP